MSLRHLPPAAVLFAIAVYLGLPAARGADLMGTEAALREIQRFVAERSTTDGAAAPNPKHERLRNDLEEFRRKQDVLTPEEAAAGWLELYRSYWNVPITTKPGGIAIAEVLAVLPEPAAWPDLQRLANRTPPGKCYDPDTALRVFAAFLNRDLPTLEKESSELRALLNKLPDRQDWNARQTLEGLDRFILNGTLGGEPRAVTAAFAKMLAGLKASEPDRWLELKVPDLAVLAGTNRAEALLLQALLLPGVRLEIPAGETTRQIARRLALEHIAQLPGPQWLLACSPSATDLYEAQSRRFLDNRDSPETPTLFLGKNVRRSDPYRYKYEEQQAFGYYVLGLLDQGKTDAAVKAILDRPADRHADNRILEAWRRQGAGVPAELLYDCFAKALKQQPETPLEDELLGTAALAGKTADFSALLEKTLADPDLTDRRKTELTESLIDTYLSNDRVEEAVALLEAHVARTLKSSDNADAGDPQLRLALRLARLGSLLQHTNWIDEALTLACSAQPADARNASYAIRNFCDFLIEIGRYSEAERLLTDSIGRQLQSANQPFRGDLMSYWIRADLVRLARLYGKAGRPDDVLALLDEAPWWGARDLADLDEEDLFAFTAQALHAKGREAEAKRILEADLKRHPGRDAAYELLIKLEGTNALPFLRQLQQRDRFEERPLIWQGVALLHDGQAAAAEQTLREALRVDPTDGEQQKGDRVRAYAVLADILDAQGKTNDAAFFRRVVVSVRVAEEGDEFKEAGLLQRALERYTAAQGYFADAYCVQWRLAERMYEQGDIQGAKEHYRLAFEHMPEQFGQVASLCFGCEGVFDKPQARGVAEEVLLRLERLDPSRPQVYFLLGQLREAQDRPGEAYQYYRKAVELDPDYLDVWEKIQALGDSLFLAPAERDAISLYMLKLDPLQRHVSVRLDGIADIAGLWKTLSANQVWNEPPATNLYPLAAGTRQLDEKEKSLSPVERLAAGVVYSHPTRISVLTPGTFLATHELVQALMQWAAQSRSDDE